MSLRVHAGHASLAVALLLAGCSGGGSSSGNTIASAVQDLGADPFGTVTVVTFGSTKGLAAATTASFEAEDGQTPTSVDVAGEVVTITWDERVSPSTRVRALLSGVSSAYANVTASDTSAPTFTIDAGTQSTGLGGDTIDLSFSGPYVVESQAEDPSSWTLVVDGTSLDLTGSTFTLDANAQTLHVVLGAGAFLYADFELAASGVHSVADVALGSAGVAGVATGDSAAPALVSAVQNLDEDEYGRVVDFTFDEAMNPVANNLLSQYGAVDAIATSVEQPTGDVLRVSFSQPIIPGVDEITLSSIVDLHGNPFPDGDVAITQPAPVTNAFDTDPTLVTVENQGSDTLTVVTTQAFDSDSALDPTGWFLDVGGFPVDMTTQTFEYDFDAKTLTITLDFDAITGDTFQLVGFGILEIDGEGFFEVFNGTIGGDASAPSFVSATQNRTYDPTGRTIDVLLSEDVDGATAEDLPNWSVTGGLTVSSATRLAGLDVVRLVLSDVALPGDVTIGADAIRDLAGNPMAATAGNAITSTDATRPSVTVAVADGVEGVDDDTIESTFDDDMYEPEITDPSSWTVECPSGNPISTTGATVAYDALRRRATLTFANGFSFVRGDTFEVAFSNARDLGGNVITTTNASGSVDVESRLPNVDAAYASSGSADVVVVRFDEPCGNLDDLYDASTNPAGTRYVLRDSGGTIRGLPFSATALDSGLGVAVSFGIVVGAGDTIDVYGVTDLAHNPLFPELAFAIDAEALQEPAVDAPTSSFTVSTGESNDEVVVAFDRALSSWSSLSISNFALEGVLSGPLDMTPATLTFDGDREVTIGLRAAANNDLQTGESYSVTVSNVRSAQGALQSAPATTAGLFAAGDALPPSVGATSVRIDPNNANSLLIETSEAVQRVAAETAASYDLDSGNLATSASRLGQRVVRATFAVAPSVGSTLELSLVDLAGNVSGSLSRVVQAADVAGPLVAGVSGWIEPGWGGDTVTVAFDESVTATALGASHYTIASGSVAISLTGARLRYRSDSNAVEIQLASGQELVAGAALSVSVGGVADFAGNVMPAPLVVGGSTTGDTTAPAFSSSFVNWREDVTGATVDVLFSEDVTTSFASTAANWTISGGQTVTSATLLERDHARLVLSAPLGVSHTLGLTGLTDLARNASGAITVDPAE